MPDDQMLQSIANLQISSRARTVLKNADKKLAPGIAAPFAVIGFKGSRWSIRSRGNTKVLTQKDEHGDETFVQTLDLVIAEAAEHHSKIYYAKAYQDGDDEVPDCWSTNGQKPDQAAPRKQCETCANCKWNEFGSRTNAATGAKGKACQDVRRLAVVPYPDIENTILGGPMLLRVPPASLGVFAEYSDFLEANAIPYSAIVSRVRFDGKESYPKFVFRALHALSDDEVERVGKMQRHPLTERIVMQQLENVVDQVGSEQGEMTKPRHLAVVGGGRKDLPGSNQVPQSGEQRTESNRAAVGNPFAQGVDSGPSYRGENRPVEAKQLAPASEPTHTPQTQPAATAAPALSPQEQKIKEMEAELARLRGEKAPRKRRTQPVSPQAQAEPAPGNASAGEPIVPDGDQQEEDDSQDDQALAAINARLDKVMQ